MKFRRLTNEELQTVENEFIAFLASNSITADEWESLKKREPKKVDLMIELFSDIVIEKALSNCQCLEKLTKHEFRTYKFYDDHVKLLVVKASKESPINFSEGSLGKTITTALKVNPNDIDFFTASKTYKKLREQEMFDVLNSGTYMTDDTMFNHLNKLIKKD